MKIEELISGKSNGEKVSVGNVSLPVSALKKFVADGYVRVRPYESEYTFSMWGKACTGCFTEQEIIERA
ncbi:MAG: hypothetical protein QG552_2539 [Thermodesulfobacteriota bacterium]|nr:hypothetical protein [Thermodesulfobacteriota bacterium]